MSNTTRRDSSRNRTSCATSLSIGSRSVTAVATTTSCSCCASSPRSPGPRSPSPHRPTSRIGSSPSGLPPEHRRRSVCACWANSTPVRVERSLRPAWRSTPTLRCRSRSSSCHAGRASRPSAARCTATAGSDPCREPSEIRSHPCADRKSRTEFRIGDAARSGIRSRACALRDVRSEFQMGPAGQVTVQATRG